MIKKLKNERYISPLAKRMNLPEIGNKAHSLLFLQRHKFRIPVTFILSSQAFEDYKEDEQAVIERLRRELAELPDLEYAIRSSTNLEDTEKYSFAGQFVTRINIRGIDNILNAIQEVWKSTLPESMNHYQLKASTRGNPVKCPVIIQEMVHAIISGVSFSKNPVTNLTEIVIEAIEGHNEDLVQRGLTPLRWRYKGGRWLEGPENFPSLSIIKRVAEDSLSLKKRNKKHVDIEWAFNGSHIYYLQIRSVTGNDRVRVYSNRMAREMLPGQIKPLVWSVNIPLVNGTCIQLLS